MALEDLEHSANALSVKLQRKKESHTGLKQHVGEYIFISRLTIYGGPVVHNKTKSP